MDIGSRSLQFITNQEHLHDVGVLLFCANRIPMALGSAVMKRSALHSLHERTLFARLRPVHKTSFPAAAGRKGDFHGGNHVVHDGFPLERRVIHKRPRRKGLLCAVRGGQKNKTGKAADLPTKIPKERDGLPRASCALSAEDKKRNRKASQGFPTTIPPKGALTTTAFPAYRVVKSFCGVCHACYHRIR